jgi:benzoyl-CoA 2,3-dioxygenase component B
MLKEEAHHMFVGTTGIDRVVGRTARLMVEHDTDDAGPHGAVPLHVIQKYLNFHYSVSLDLFGGETSTNVANYYSAGVKGRWQEERRKDDHRLTDQGAFVDTVEDGRPSTVEVEALTALNTDLRDEYIDDCESGVKRWNRILSEAGLPHRLALPHRGFNRYVGAFAGINLSPAGEVLTDGEWEARKSAWLPTETDKTFVASLMRPVYEPGKIASWLEPPRNGINGKPFDYEYVHFL